MSRDLENKYTQEPAVNTPIVKDYGNTLRDHTDQRFSKPSANTFTVYGVIVAVGLLLALLYVVYYVMTAEQQRIDAAPPPEAAVPVQPDARTQSPDPTAPSFPAQPSDSDSTTTP